MLCQVGTSTERHARVVRDGIVGRRRELDAVREWLDAARGGDGRLVLCVGEPGIGKTRLAQELAGLALATGTAVAWGCCAEAEGAPAFWPWRQVLRSLGVDPDSLLTSPSATYGHVGRAAGCDGVRRGWDGDGATAAGLRRHSSAAVPGRLPAQRPIGSAPVPPNQSFPTRGGWVTPPPQPTRRFPIG